MFVFKVTLDSISFFLVNPFYKSYSLPEKAIAYAVSFFFGISTWRLAPHSAIGWRKFSHKKPLLNDAYEKVSSVFARIIGGVEFANHENLITMAIDYSFLESIIDSYKPSIETLCEDLKRAKENEKNHYQKQVLFFTLELLNCREHLKTLLEDIESLGKKNYSHETIKQLEGLKSNCTETIENFTDLLQQIEIQFPSSLSESILLQTIQRPSKEIKKRVGDLKGLYNQGNSCYMNAALQTLFVIDNFIKLLPEKIVKVEGESESDFSDRQRLVEKFKNLVNEYSKPNNSPQKLGELVGQLRWEIFQSTTLKSSLFIGEDLFEQLDSGDFFQLILSITGLNYQVETRKTYTRENEMSYEGRSEITPTGCYLLKEKGSIQNKVNMSGQEKQDILDDPYIASNNVSYTEFNETNKILGNPPPLFIFQMDSTQGYKVKQEDKEIDCKALFENKIEGNEAKYKLVGFAQNLGQAHWVSVVYKDGKPYKCDDSDVYEINEEAPAFTTPAHYLVYEKIKT